MHPSRALSLSVVSRPPSLSDLCLRVTLPVSLALHPYAHVTRSVALLYLLYLLDFLAGSGSSGSSRQSNTYSPTQSVSICTFFLFWYQYSKDIENRITQTSADTSTGPSDSVLKCACFTGTALLALLAPLLVYEAFS